MPEAAGAGGLPEGLSEDDLTIGGGDSKSTPHAASAPAASPAEPSVGVGELEPSWPMFVHGWQLGIYRDPVLCGSFAGLTLGVLGVFIVLRRAVFVTAAVSQSAALGVALAFYASVRFGFGVPPVLGALVLALSSTAVLALSSERMRLTRESLLGFAYLFASASAILIGDRIAQEAHDIAAILFGTAVMVRRLDLWLVIGGGTLVLALLAVGYRGLVFSGFDRDSARVHGVPVRTLEVGFWVLVAGQVSVATRALGALPVFAFAVLPAMSALAIGSRMRNVLVISALLGALAGGFGYLLAFLFRFPVGASQAGLSAVCFLCTLPWALLRKRRH